MKRLCSSRSARPLVYNPSREATCFLPSSWHARRRELHASPQKHTDGVFRALTDARISMPWIEAFRNRYESEKHGVSEQGAAQTQSESKSKERDLSPKTMQDSFHCVVLPLAGDPWLSDTYINSSGQLRLGTVFMDLDALSGIIAYKHTGDGVTTVTAAVDRITIENPVTELCDLEYSGQVTYAKGGSSMEITCKVAKAPPEGQQRQDEAVLMTITFTMVSLNPQTKKSVPIPALRLTTDAERATYNLGESRSRAKKALAAQSLLSHAPREPEAALTHRLWQHQLASHDPNNPTRIPPNVTPMSRTRLQTASIMQPQYRNRHNFMIFGGFLLKQTFELAFCCAASFAHARPVFVSADPCTFLNPVPVGSVLYLTATVVYADPPLVEGEDGDGGAGQKAADGESQGDEPRKTRVSVRVDSKVRDVEHGSAKPTGQFHYTFTVEREVKVMPETYQEHILYLDGRRRSMRVVGEIEGSSGESKAAHQSFTE